MTIAKSSLLGHTEANQLTEYFSCCFKLCCFYAIFPDGHCRSCCLLDKYMQVFDSIEVRDKCSPLQYALKRIISGELMNHFDSLLDFRTRMNLNNSPLFQQK
ncbi:unnamed protein product [Moneuplotes crassus]|uniref:Uncharacterized protein n=1 Tax=Euplotes crassus TaxID=5936 RepID=A0AAD1X7E6_EUPCR|nr:unnamed protein product [Moneuplotes crassus]